MQDRMNIYFEAHPAPPRRMSDGVIALSVLGICFFLGALTMLGVIALVVVTK